MQIPVRDELHLWFVRQDQGMASDDFLRDVLSRYAGVAPAALELGRGTHGKPALIAPDLSLVFNLSDCRDWLVLVIGGGAAVGVDLEYCDDQRDILRLADRCFSEAEVQQLSDCPSDEQVFRFYELWTLKEAAVKAAGRSLGQELESTHFHLEYEIEHACGSIPGRITADAPPWAEGFWFGLSRPFDDHRLALCSAGTGPVKRILRYAWPKEEPVASSKPLLAVSSPAELDIQGSY